MTVAGSGGNWDSVNGSGGTVYLASGQAVVTGGGDTVNFQSGSGNAVTLANTANNWDSVNGSGGMVYLISAQAVVTGGGDTVNFHSGSGNAVTLANTAVKDISPLRGATKLRVLDVTGTPITDTSMLQPALGKGLKVKM